MSAQWAVRKTGTSTARMGAMNGIGAMVRNALCVIAPVALALGAAAAQAQDYPKQPVKMIMPFGPGGPTDIVARLLAQQLTSKLGQTFLVENRPGANGIIGTEVVAKSPADGYTLLVAPTAHVINPSIYKKLPYDTFRDFASVAFIGNSPGLVLAVTPGVAKDVKEFIGLAKAKDTKIAYGSGGVGNFQHLAGEYFNMTVGTSMIHVPYKSAGQVVTAMYGGEVQASFLGPVQAVEIFKSGKLRPLAVTSLKRLPQLPDVPTMVEAGYPNFELDGGIQAAVYAPAKTPREIIVKLNREINAALQDPALQERFKVMAMDTPPGGPEALDQQVKARFEKYGAIVRAAKIEPE
jgi:tripartite-type tricarboxylate transporter receptor subunit TctC